MNENTNATAGKAVVSLPPFRNLGPYEIERTIACGGMAEVYVARRMGSHGFQKKVALKCILPQYVSDPDFVGMFIDEARLAARLDHPNIVHVFDFGEADQSFYLAMEMVEGSNVSRLLRASTHDPYPIPVPAVLHIVLCAAKALEYAHSLTTESGTPLHIVHRDVSPANLLLSTQGNVLLSDFGIARSAQTLPRTQEGHIRGKLGYMSPEQVSGDAIGPASDIFTLMTVFAELLIRRPMFGSGNDIDVLLRIRGCDLKNLREHGKNISPVLLDLIESTLVQNPADRPTASQLRKKLEQLAKDFGGASSGDLEIQKLLLKYELAPLDHPDLQAVLKRAPTLPPINIKTSDRIRHELGQTIIDDGKSPMLAQTNVLHEQPLQYDILLPDQKLLSNLPYHEVVKKIVLGEISPHSMARIQDAQDFHHLREHDDFKRFVSPAFAWDHTLEHEDDDTLAYKRGVIEPHTILSLIHNIHKRHQTGALNLRNGSHKKRLFFIDGKVDFVSSNNKKELFGEYLIQNGYCIRMEVEMGLSMLQRWNGKLGDALVSMGVLRPIHVFKALASQLRDRIDEAFSWEDGEWEFHEDLKALEETFPLPVETFELIRDAVARLEPKRLERSLKLFEKRTVSRILQSGGSLVWYNLPKPWLDTISLANAKLEVNGLILAAQRNGIQKIDAQRAIYFGIHCDILSSSTP